MHLITAVIKPHMLDSVKEALAKDEVSGMTVTEAKGFGRQGGHTETYRGAEYKLEFLPKLKIEIVAEASRSEAIVDALRKAAATGKIGDGKIWVSPIETLVRIRTGELNSDAL